MWYYIFLACQAVAVAVSAVVVFYTWSFQYWKRRNIPYLPASIPFGNLSSPLWRKIPLGFEILNLYNEARDLGLTTHCGLYIMAKPSYMVLDLELTRLILSKDFNYFTDRGLYKNERHDPLSAHLFALGGSKWRNLRTKLSPTYTPVKMKAMFPYVVECGKKLGEYLGREIHAGEPADIRSAMRLYAMDIVGSCAFGLECNCFERPNSNFANFGRKILDRSKLHNLLLLFGTTFPKLGNALGIRVVPKELSDYFYHLVERTIAHRQKNDVNRADFLDLLMKIIDFNVKNGTKGDGQTLTMDEAVAQCIVFFVAGYETSSTTMSFCLFELGQNTDIQDRVRSEISEILKRHNGELTLESLKEMVYLDQVIEETLRKYPPLPFITRVCVQDWRIPGTTKVIEKGTRVKIPIIGYHHDPEIFEDPDKFDPDRFSPENRGNIHQFAYIPFGEGPRICIGMKFAMMQTKIGLLTTVKNYKVGVNKRTRVPLVFSKNTFVPGTEGGLWLDLEKLET